MQGQKAPTADVSTPPCPHPLCLSLFLLPIQQGYLVFTELFKRSTIDQSYSVPTFKICPPLNIATLLTQSLCVYTILNTMWT